MTVGPTESASNKIFLRNKEICGLCMYIILYVRLKYVSMYISKDPLLCSACDQTSVVDPQRMLND